MTIHEQLLACRKYRKMTARELARLSGISFPQISTIENGRAHPQADTIEALAQALDCEIRIFPRNL